MCLCHLLIPYFGTGLCCASCLQPFQPTPAPVPTPLAGWMSNPTTVAHAAVSGGGAIGLGGPSIPGNILFAFCYSLTRVVVLISHRICLI